ncbi:jg4992 [Pararge aegeria aegeria]|uniref:Jg4992 protein n=1 Tax=Pararge aegeria aegeria TaxID=348720 RepID=A0A8S4S2S5_9NEOP|nr:jg4992 [Pararge aegeria aegeria]
MVELVEVGEVTGLTVIVLFRGLRLVVDIGGLVLVGETILESFRGPCSVFFEVSGVAEFPVSTFLKFNA